MASGWVASEGEGTTAKDTIETDRTCRLRGRVPWFVGHDGLSIPEASNIFTQAAKPLVSPDRLLLLQWIDWQSHLLHPPLIKINLIVLLALEHLPLHIITSPHSCKGSSDFVTSHFYIKQHHPHPQRWNRYASLIHPLSQPNAPSQSKPGLLASKPWMFTSPGQLTQRTFCPACWNHPIGLQILVIDTCLVWFLESPIICSRDVRPPVRSRKPVR